MIRLLYLVSHPIQYQAPLLRRIAKAPGIQLRVIFGSVATAQSYRDIGFGRDVAWDVPLLDGGTRPFARRPGNWLVLRAGRPVLLIEQQGKRLTALASASADDLAAAVGCLPAILTSRHKLTVDEWNNAPVTTTPGRDLLEAAGFVRDYQAMTLYKN